MNDFFLKYIEKLGSIDNTALFAASIFPYAIFLFYIYKINFYKTPRDANPKIAPIPKI